MEHFIKKHYPEAQEGKVFTRDLVEKLTDQHKFDLTKTLLATSVCSDEIIRSATNFREYVSYSHPFSLGGLAGIPFSGLTGFKAFASHIPDNGSAIILYGPHIGVSENGTVGIVERVGQNRPSTCCGALKASVDGLSDKNASSADLDIDYQMSVIEREVRASREKVVAHDIPLVAATDAMYGFIHERMHKLMEGAKESFQNYKVALIGGVIINTDYTFQDWFELRNFKVISR
jgi:hypothetical protein